MNEVYFNGNAPATFGSNVFSGTASDFTVYYTEDATGWTTPQWNGYNTVTFVSEKTVPVTGISLDRSSLTMIIGGTDTLVATVSPDDADNKEITWGSSNPSVVTVSNTGVVTAKSTGTATITVTTSDGGFTATCSVTVRKELTGNEIAITAGTVKGNIGNTINVEISLTNNIGIWGMDVGVSYDESVLELVEVKNGTVFSDTELTEVILTNNPVALSYEGSEFNNITESGTVATLVFKIKEDAQLGKYDITLVGTDGDVIDADGNEISFVLNNGSVEITDILYGDVNNDGKVSKADSLMLKKYLAKWEVEINEAAADVNGDGKVSKADSLLLKKYLAKWDVTLGPSA